MAILAGILATGPPSTWTRAPGGWPWMKTLTLVPSTTRANPPLASGRRRAKTRRGGTAPPRAPRPAPAGLPLPLPRRGLRDPHRRELRGDFDVGEVAGAADRGGPGPDGHPPDAFFEGRLGRVLEDGLEARMVGVGDLDLVAGLDVADMRGLPEGADHDLGQLVHARVVIRADVEDLVLRLRGERRARDSGDDVADVGERAALLAVAEDRDVLAAEDLAHEDADDVAVLVPE